MANTSSRKTRPITLALQGGGAHGAFTWGVLDVLLGNWSLDNSPGYLFLDLLSRVASPYDLNPLNLNPLKDLLERTVDFERV